MTFGVSVIIPCRNEEGYIADCINSLLNNQFDAELEIIVVDGQSTDNTVQIVQSIIEDDPRVKLIQNKRRITPVALNLGINEANKEYVLIASAHSSYEREYIGVLLQKMQETQADVAGGVMKTEVKHSTPKSRAIVKVLSHPLGVGNSSFRTGVDQDQQVDTVPFGLYKRALLVEAGGYDERLVRNHDIELSKRLLARGAKIILSPDVSCSYYAREHFSELAKNNFRNGMWNLFVVRITRNSDSLSLRHFIPLTFILTLIILAGLAFYDVFFLLAFLFLSVIYLATLSVISITLKSNFFYTLIAFIVLHFSYGFGSLSGLFRTIPESSYDI